MVCVSSPKVYHASVIVSFYLKKNKYQNREYGCIFLRKCTLVKISISILIRKNLDFELTFQLLETRVTIVLSSLRLALFVGHFYIPKFLGTNDVWYS